MTVCFVLWYIFANQNFWFFFLPSSVGRCRGGTRLVFGVLPLETTTRPGPCYNLFRDISVSVSTAYVPTCCDVTVDFALCGLPFLRMAQILLRL